MWSIRLAGGKLETGVLVESIDVEEGPEKENGEESDASEAEDEEEKPKAPKKGKKKAGRGRQTARGGRGGAVNGNGAGKKKEVMRNFGEEYLNELDVKLNGRIMEPEDEGGWVIDLAPGGSVLDIGAWRVFLDRH